MSEPIIHTRIEPPDTRPAYTITDQEEPVTPYRDRLNAGEYQQGKTKPKTTSTSDDTAKTEPTQTTGRRTGRKPHQS